MHTRPTPPRPSSSSYAAFAACAGLAASAALGACPPPRYPDAPSVTIGRAAALTSVRAAFDGSWVVLCQARRIAVHTPREGTQEVGAVLVADSRSGVLLLGRGARLELHRPGERTRDVGAFDAEMRLEEGLAAAISRDGARLAFVRMAERGKRAVVIDLESGAERELEHGEGELVGIRGVEGDWIDVEVAIASAGERAAELEAIRAWPCTPEARDGAPRAEAGARRERRLLHVPTGAIVVREAGISPLAGGLLVATEAGELVRRSVEGLESPVAPASCGPLLLEAQRGGARILLACTGLAGCVPSPASPCRVVRVEVADATESATLPLDIESVEGVAIGVDGRFFHRARSQGADVLVVFDEDARPTLLRDERPIAIEAQRLLVATGDESVAIVDLSSGDRTVLRAARDGYPPARAGSLVATRGLVIDLSRAAVVGTYPHGVRPWALTTEARLLVAASSEADQGPLVWRDMTRASR